MNLTNGIALVATDATGNMVKGVPAAIIGPALQGIGENASAADCFRLGRFAFYGHHISTHIPPPGYPSTEEGHWCTNFKDDFDWSSLEPEYLASIGATEDGALREKPLHVDPHFAKS